MTDSRSDTPRTNALIAELESAGTEQWIDDLADLARQLERELTAKQAVIDRLMLEYCPDEMTPEQVLEWEKHQRGVEHE